MRNGEVVDSELALRLNKIEKVMARNSDNQSDPTATAAYNEMYAAAGCPVSWTKPLPYFAGSSTNRKFAYTRGCTAPQTVTLAAGGNIVFAAQPNRLTNPIRGYSSAGLMTTTTSTITVAASTLDQTIAASVNSGWIRHSPFHFFSDTGGFSGDNVNHPGITDYEPPLVQCMGGEIDLKVAVPYDGQAVVRYISMGDHPNTVGHKHQQHRPLLTDNVGSVIGRIEPGFHAMATMPFVGDTNRSCIDIIAEYSEPVLMTGASPKGSLDFKLSITPDTSFAFAGTMSTTDAPDGQRVCNASNFRTRDGMLDMLNRGVIHVQNTGSVAITLVVSGHFVFAQVLQTDTGVQTISNLASTMALTARHLEKNVPTGNVSNAMPVMVGPSRAAVESMKKEHLKTRGVPEAIAKDAVAAQSAPQAFLDRLPQNIETVTKSVSAARSLWSELKGVWNGVKTAVMVAEVATAL